MPVISVTRLRLRARRFLPGFFFYAIRSSRQARRAPGNLAVDLRHEPGLAFWTLTGWTDEDAMKAFVLSGAHKAAMPRLLHWCDEASVLHWTQDSPMLPDWAEARRRMAAEGRLSKVRYPSAAHAAGRRPGAA